MNLEKKIHSFVELKQGICSTAAEVGYNFFSEYGKKIENHEKKSLLLDFYLSAKAILGLQWRHQIKDYDIEYEYPLLQAEEDLLNIDFEKPITSNSFSVLFDIPIFWFDEDTNKISKVILPGGFVFRFTILPFNPIASNIAIHATFCFNLFSKHILPLDYWVTTAPKLYYFEPAARLNRQLIRSFATKVSEKANLIVEFSPSKNWVFPKDDFGYLDGADYVIQS